MTLFSGELQSICFQPEIIQSSIILQSPEQVENLSGRLAFGAYPL